MAVDAVGNRALCGFPRSGGRVLCVHGSGSVHSRPGRGVRGSALGLSQGRAVDPDGVALMAEATEERVNEGVVAEERLPFRVV